MGRFDVASRFSALWKSPKGLPEQLRIAQELIEALPIPVFFKGRDGKYLGVNKAWEEFFGILREDFIGKTVYDLYSQDPGAADRHAALDQELWNHPGRQSYEIPITTRDGRVRHIIDYKATFARRDDEIAGLVGTIIDITERKQAETAWRESEARFRSLTELSSDWYWEQDRELRLSFHSNGFARRSGTTSDKLLGKHRWEEANRFPLNCTWDEHRAVLEAHEPFKDFEYVRIGDDGKQTFVSLSGVPIFDAAGNFSGYRGVGTNITERKTAEAELREAHDELSHRAQELARSNEELQQFAYVASHDLQEPLRMISSYTQLLLRRYGGLFDQDAREFMNFIVDGAAHMKQLIEDLLAYSRVGTRVRDFRPVESESALRKALNNLQAAMDSSGATVTRDPLPAVTADESQLVQLFQNLIGNAIKFRGAGAPRIHIGAQAQGAEWVFAVRDNGIGIDPQYFERIFMMFQRLHSKDEYPGTGIGLAICKKIVDRHGGRIWVESRPGQECTFYFALPEKQEGHNHG